MDLRTASAPSATLDTLKIHHRTLDCLPLDPELCTDEQAKTGKARVPRDNISHSCFSLTHPTPVLDPVLVSASRSALGLLDIPIEEAKKNEFIEYFSGCNVMPESRPAAHTYCGHQFGHFSGQLGDGAAIYLGEVENPKTMQVWEMQLKGSGLTPYSRRADGRKVLRSSIREYLCSEAMHFLGVPTTRAASCITSSTRVVRDIFYTGNNIEERSTVVLRLAQTFLRFGSFEIFKPEDALTGRAGPSSGLEHTVVPLGMDKKRQGPFLQTMVDFTISTYFPEIWSAHRDDADRVGCYAAWVREVAERTARLVAHWQAVGFCHGVLNTDNMSIVGVTVDYGPFGFMERFDPDWACNHSDDGGRYTYSRQRDVCRWNCEKLAEAVAPLFPAEKRLALDEAVGAFDAEFERWWLRLFRRKLGLVRVVELEEAVERAEQAEAKLQRGRASHAASEAALEEAAKEAAKARRALGACGISAASDKELVEQLLQVMKETGADFTDTFRGLLRMDDLRDGSSTHRFIDWLLPRLASPAQMAKGCKSRMPFEQLQLMLMLGRQSPAVLQQVGLSVDALMGELRIVERRKALSQMRAGEKRAGDKAAWVAWVERYWERLLQEPAPAAGGERKAETLLGGGGQRRGAEAVESEVVDAAQRRRAEAMRRANPHTVLRNAVAQAAIERAEAGDFSEVTRVLELLADPYSEDLVVDVAFKWDRRASGREGRAAEVSMQWRNFKLLPPNETLSIELPSFSCGRAAGEERVPLEVEGTHVSRVRVEWGGDKVVLTVTGEALAPGEHVMLTLTRANLIFLPDSGVTWHTAREEPVPLEGGWYQLVVAEEYKRPPPDWATELCVSCSS